MLITVEQLRLWFDADFETGTLYHAGTRRACPAGKVVGTYNRYGHLRCGIRGKEYRIHRILWAMYYGEWPVTELDHINRVRDDNRICNLREVSSAQNKWNRLGGLRGVHYDTRYTLPYRAHISEGRQQICLGRYDTLIDAFAARLAAERARGAEYMPHVQ